MKDRLLTEILGCRSNIFIRAGKEVGERTFAKCKKGRDVSPCLYLFICKDCEPEKTKEREEVEEVGRGERRKHMDVSKGSCQECSREMEEGKNLKEAGTFVDSDSD